ncbi:MAG: ATP synthase subunit I [Polyangiaceae bacterium]
MTGTSMLVRGAVFGAGGFMAGAAHFAGLRANARLYLLGPGSARKWAIFLHTFRMGTLAFAWLVIARFGAAALFGALVGLLGARHTMTWRALRGP